ADSSGRGTLLFYLLYQGIFALGICIFVPVFYTLHYRKERLSSIGITSEKWLKAVLVGVLIAVLTAGGSMIHKTLFIPAAGKLAYLIVCLIMSTLFEEVFFRGFLQTRFEKYFGMVPAIVIAGICFALYHIGYSDMRNINDIAILAAVGIVFSISFRITGNIITSYIVNLPNAVITFMGRGSYFDITSAAVSLAATIAGLGVIYFLQKAYMVKRGKNESGRDRA
ncbi:MAG: CPBP family intramembrane glutamic endopeptidase, partial [Brevinematales bacterium]